MATDMIPKSYKPLLEWLDIQQTLTPEIAPSIGMTDAEQAEVQGAINAILPKIKQIVSLTGQIEHLRMDLDPLLGPNLQTLRKAIKRGKTSSGCTPSIVARMHWLGERNEVDPATQQPSITASIVGSGIKIDGTKVGFDAVNLYMRRKGETEWKLIAIRKRRFPIYDETPLLNAGIPEVREYRCVGVVDDNEIGIPSVIIEVVFAG